MAQRVALAISGLVLIGVTWLRWRQGGFGGNEDPAFVGALDRAEGLLAARGNANLWEVRAVAAVLLVVAGGVALVAACKPRLPLLAGAVGAGVAALALAYAVDDSERLVLRTVGASDVAGVARDSGPLALPVALAAVALAVPAVSAWRFRGTR